MYFGSEESRVNGKSESILTRDKDSDNFRLIIIPNTEVESFLLCMVQLYVEMSELT